MSFAEEYAARVTAYDEMRRRWRGGAPGEQWSGAIAEQARADPRRTPDANLEALAALLDPHDTLVDVGGGAGRMGLALALRCREVINVDPSPAMQAAFERTAHESGIQNARFVHSAWPAAAADVSGDVVLTTHVTYFVRDIVPFVQGLQRAARKRVIIELWSQPPPTMGAQVYERVLGGPFEAPPGHRQLLPVLWDMGILPEVRVLPLPMRQNYTWLPEPTREGMVERALRVVQLNGSVDPAAARAQIERDFDELFVLGKHGYHVRWPDSVRDMLITWTP